MGNNAFESLCKKEIIKYYLEHGVSLMPEDVYVVWSCKTLQNNKALLSTKVSDGMYYELTYNGDRRELYFDAYKKAENKCIKVGY